MPHIFSGIFWGLEARVPFTNNDTVFWLGEPSSKFTSNATVWSRTNFCPVLVRVLPKV